MYAYITCQYYVLCPVKVPI
uniref:Uncharacterized protein n=1 Tax=Anguilla anguilla TaxID=7936 RepID=A0A0E9QWL0_ANGAN